MIYDYVTLDVFTDRCFGGNPLAVLPAADGLTTKQMQAIAREFNYSETTFVLPPADDNNTRKVRIFTPLAELPFAGHPNVGTAVALARLELLGDAVAGQRLLFEEGAGTVSVFLRGNHVAIDAAEFIAPVINRLEDELTHEEGAKALGLKTAQVVTEHHPPRIVSSGVRFLFIELRDLDALAASEAAQGPVTRISVARGLDGVFGYVRTGDNGVDFRARMFAPVHGVMEDPATGSANAGLANLLGSMHEERDATLTWTVAQGVEMGRPSRLLLTAERRGGKIVEVRVAGGAVIVCRGQIDVPER
ncbi:MAG TPA: PhzF family phenazine biosynthesis protein [Candidatus Polarisedimenticolaceae bacterium]|nr:PhzF family phenazine biosynthesis protein [Candidatus Polarisedimenticolaceae bacterium]